jgi:transmembrane sensor
MVTEGTVVIERDGQEIARVTAGERYALSPSGDTRRAARQPEEITRALVWREGKVSFAGQTLREGAAEFNRYNSVKIEIEDPAVGAMRFGGYYRATDPDGFVAALEKTLPVQSERRGDTIVISSR